ncbi:DUF502 domain-containing protein [Sulfurovum sp.]|uniref:DUF502 domain-containing protein n=1 Tax=Sulfurovum sp. TaxID=1969726 RepID=UPI002867B194|nr:DUF502 domain-containing protein [Sulfurovum sp.]
MNFKPVKHFIKIMLQGLFWLLPIVAILIILSWLYGKIDMLVGKVFRLIGFAPESHEFLWSLLVISIFLVILYILGWFVKTRLADLFEYLFCKIPGYNTIKGLVGIFNSSKEGKNQVLVVAIKGFATQGYNIGLMYSQKESIIKDHYTVTLSMSPIPNGGFMFEVPKEKIFVIEHATFDNNLQYLLSMGVRSFTEILKTEPKNIDELMVLTEWLKLEENKKDI